MVADVDFVLEKGLIICLDFLFHVHVLGLVRLCCGIIEKKIDSCCFESLIIVFFSDIDFFLLEKLLYFIVENNFCLN